MVALSQLDWDQQTKESHFSITYSYVNLENNAAASMIFLKVKKCNRDLKKGNQTLDVSESVSFLDWEMKYYMKLLLESCFTGSFFTYFQTFLECPRNNMPAKSQKNGRRFVWYIPTYHCSMPNVHKSVS